MLWSSALRACGGPSFPRGRHLITPSISLTSVDEASGAAWLAGKPLNRWLVHGPANSRMMPSDAFRVTDRLALTDLLHSFRSSSESPAFTFGSQMTNPSIERGMTYNFVDLFSCGGGMSRGFKDAGFRSIGAVDLEVAKPTHGINATNCNATYATNIGLTPLSADLSIATPSDVASHFGFKPSDVDVLISCAPCTGFSQKQSRNHAADDARNQLVERTAVFAAEWRPQYIVVENVKELLRGRHKHHFQGLHRSLTSLGYEVFAEVHDLKSFGLPQSRIRALIVAKLADEFQLRIPKVDRYATVRDAIGALPKQVAGEVDPRDPMHVSPNMKGLSLDRMRAIPKDGGSWIDIPSELSFLRIPSMNVEKPGSFPDIYGRLAWDRVAPTITRECSHPGNGRYCHPEQDRLLTVREMALLQGFPADYTFVGSLSMKYRQIGDAVPPLISRQIACAILADAKGSAQAQVHGIEQYRLAV
ncbi:DNA (cytosine-5)-methyltransferase 1 [Tardiphaga robiniae]|uniref:DNA cytosine methyltransferase n=1 Tax=Tardiphaga robiniae TaxID=943830 RepID=UPI00285750BA|nr:DNA cytosine methyltransferase [Tardiphaga robiniae]MDR6657784.1 DNA (cytosine-5)-methyltransferase 1 [Tardiphaga robiniae]